mmetsp:Transcript_54948/g.176211  ORF Transcript_54948/g.176211 Transcript_54948/m.176211 type:complete len:263 (-) Transcript_54948:643-1431(-)
MSMPPSARVMSCRGRSLGLGRTCGLMRCSCASSWAPGIGHLLHGVVSVSVSASESAPSSGSEEAQVPSSTSAGSSGALTWLVQTSPTAELEPQLPASMLLGGLPLVSSATIHASWEAASLPPPPCPGTACAAPWLCLQTPQLPAHLPSPQDPSMWPTAPWSSHLAPASEERASASVPSCFAGLLHMPSLPWGSASMVTQSSASESPAEQLCSGPPCAGPPWDSQYVPNSLAAAPPMTSVPKLQSPTPQTATSGLAPGISASA